MAKLPAEELTSMKVAGFKSIRDEQEIEFRNLTVLAGANSSGKSSMMQPLLLMKQTLDSGADKGPLALDGPHVLFSRAEQLFWRGLGERTASFTIKISTGQQSIEEEFRLGEEGIELTRGSVDGGVASLELRLGEYLDAATASKIVSGRPFDLKVKMVRWRCFIDLAIVSSDAPGTVPRTIHWTSGAFSQAISDTIHLPGLRGNPRRSYPYHGPEVSNAGVFHELMASLIANWNVKSPEMKEAGEMLSRLGLAWKVRASKISDVNVEINVSRLSEAARGGARDLVNIADAGLGVSQALPVVVALVAARPKQLAFIEQPEIHLHPRAQVILAELIAETAARGPKLVIETHSDLLLLGIQKAVATGKLTPDQVRLYWFERQKDGATKVTPAEFADDGSFGDWPVDFGDARLKAQREYLDAVSR